MSKFRFDFLNWRPDIEDYSNDGLVTADNLLHSPEGYRSIKRRTIGAFTTHPALATCPSIAARSLGTSDDMIIAYIGNVTQVSTSTQPAQYTFDLNITKMRNTDFTISSAYTSVTSATVTSGFTTNAIKAFETCELANYIFVTAQAEGTNSGSAVTVNATGYIAI